MSEAIGAALCVLVLLGFVDSIPSSRISHEIGQEAGEGLGELLGRALETKMLVSSSVGILENLS
jgi:hypothetical protein